MAAGGIVLQRGETPLFAVVCLRKRADWVLPKGKLDLGETPRAAAQREVLEETGHEVTIGEFLGTLAYPIGAGIKIVHYWRMEASAEPAHKLMRDVTAVEWLPLPDALARLTRSHEQAFLAQVGPLAIAAMTGTAREASEGEMTSPPYVAAPARIKKPKTLFGKFWRWLKG